MVERLVKSQRYQTTLESIEDLNNLSLECEVRAAIASDDKLWDQTIMVNASGSMVALRGIVKNAKVRDAIMEIASQVKGVAECTSYIKLLSDPLHGGIYGKY
jgi:osmotically-inducible protein OsmY